MPVMNLALPLIVLNIVILLWSYQYINKPFCDCGPLFPPFLFSFPHEGEKNVQ